MMNTRGYYKQPVARITWAACNSYLIFHDKAGWRLSVEKCEMFVDVQSYHTREEAIQDENIYAKPTSGQPMIDLNPNADRL